MDKKQKLEYQQKIEKYFSEHHVYDLLEDLTTSLMIHQPADPMSFLIDKLSGPPVKKIFIVGPPGYKIR